MYTTELDIRIDECMRAMCACCHLCHELDRWVYVRTRERSWYHVRTDETGGEEVRKCKAAHLVPRLMELRTLSEGR